MHGLPTMGSRASVLQRRTDYLTQCVLAAKAPCYIAGASAASSCESHTSLSCVQFSSPATLLVLGVLCGGLCVESCVWETVLGGLTASNVAGPIFFWPNVGT